MPNSLSRLMMSHLTNNHQGSSTQPASLQTSEKGHGISHTVLLLSAIAVACLSRVIIVGR